MSNKEKRFNSQQQCRRGEKLNVTWWNVWNT